MKIPSIINKNLLSVNLRGRGRDAVIDEIMEAVARQLKLKNNNEIVRALRDREAKGTTAIGDGIALPHARIDGLKEPVVYAGVSQRGIDFGAPDNKPVHLVVLFLTPLADTATHLKLLANITALLKNRYLVSRLLSAPDTDELYRVLKAGEVERAGFLSLTADEVYKELDTGPGGLSDADARRRLAEYGRNELRQIRRTSLLRRFLSNFTNILALLMWVGAGLAFLVNIPEVGGAIIAVIIINALFSFWQEFKAEKALAALRNLIPSYVRAMRDGQEKKVLSIDVVPGDIVIFEEGDSIPADSRLLEAHELRVDNSVFSGESRPGYKAADAFPGPGNLNWTEIPNLVFAGTSVVSGNGRAVVIATGMATEIGRIAYLTQSVKEELSPLQKEIVQLTRIIAAIAVATGLVFLLIGRLAAGLTLAGAAVFAIGIILGNVPEGLLPTVTLSLAIAVQRMSGRHALIKKLSSVETLGSTNVICTDKTGTLTTNQISVRRLWLNGRIIEVSGSSYEPKGDFLVEGKKAGPQELERDKLDLLLRASTLCSTAKIVAPSEAQKFWNVIGDPTEGALIVMAGKAGFNIERVREHFPYVKRFPFEAIRKRMSSVNRMDDGSLRAFVKGAPRELVDLSSRLQLGDNAVPLTRERRAELAGWIDRFANDGLRVLGIAYREAVPSEVEGLTAERLERDLTFIGLTAMYDPPRPEVKDALALCAQAGIRVVMITGDYGLTALAIGKQVGIITSDTARVITGAELNDMTNDALKEALRGEVIFARVNPEHKLRVVAAFKELGNIVAVTGDGVNDAPALKRSDIGVAMGIRGTDVAKESAEMILTDDNFASIVYAIEEGRAVFSNIKKFITYIFAHLVPEAVPFILYIIFRLPVPITALQILAIDLGTETLPALALGTEPPEKGIMDLPPRPRKQGLVDRLVLFRGYVFLGLLNTAAVLAAYFITLYSGGWRPGMQLEPDDITFTNPLHLKAMTMVFTGIVVMQIANVFAVRSERQSAFTIGFFSNKLILWGIAFELAFTCALIYIPFLQRIFNTTPIGPADWGMLFAFMLAVFFLEELRKRLLYKGTPHGGRGSKSI